MTLRVIGAGLPRTGTTSLKAALERLLGEPCYHMTEFFPRGEADGPLIWRAFDGDTGLLDQVLDGFAAAIDWPISLFWRELAEQHPDALVLLSRRASPEVWWTSVDRTVWEAMRRPSDVPGWDAFVGRMLAKAGFADDWDDPLVAKATYVSLIDDVRAAVATDRLLIWEPGDGWEPLAAALGVEPPDEPFPKLNDTAAFRAESSWDVDEGDPI